MIMIYEIGFSFVNLKTVNKIEASHMFALSVQEGKRERERIYMQTRLRFTQVEKAH